MLGLKYCISKSVCGWYAAKQQYSYCISLRWSLQSLVNKVLYVTLTLT